MAFMYEVPSISIQSVRLRTLRKLETLLTFITGLSPAFASNIKILVNTCLIKIYNPHYQNMEYAFKLILF